MQLCTLTGRFCVWLLGGAVCGGGVGLKISRGGSVGFTL